MIGHAEIPPIRVNSKNSVTKSRLISVPKNSLLNLWKAGDFVAGGTAEELVRASAVA